MRCGALLLVAISSCAHEPSRFPPNLGPIGSATLDVMEGCERVGEVEGRDTNASGARQKAVKRVRHLGATHYVVTSQGVSPEAPFVWRLGPRTYVVVEGFVCPPAPPPAPPPASPQEALERREAEFELWKKTGKVVGGQ